MTSKICLWLWGIKNWLICTFYYSFSNEGIPRYQHYQYDRINQLIEIQHDKSPYQQFDYDGKGRLIHIKQCGEETRYRYDGAGNREMLPISANDVEWSKPLTLREVAHNRLLQDNDSHYHYDAFGNRIQKQRHRLILHFLSLRILEHTRVTMNTAMTHSNVWWNLATTITVEVV